METEEALDIIASSLHIRQIDVNRHVLVREQFLDAVADAAGLPREAYPDEVWKTAAGMWLKGCGA